MNRRKMQVDLPKDAADYLDARATMQGVPVDRYLGSHVLRSAFGVMHPEVVEFERANVGQTGTDKQGDDNA